MQAAIPAAGEGTRLRPLTAETPKPLVSVAGQPLLTHVFETLLGLAEPISEFVVVIGHRGEQIRSHYGESVRETPITYVEQPAPRGLADALRRAAPRLDPPFLWFHGDNVCRANCGALPRRHRETDAAATCLVEEVSRERASAGGVFELGDGAGDERTVTGLVEKPADPPSRLIPRGCWVFEDPIIHACQLVTPGHTGEAELSAAVDLLLRAGWPVELVELEGWCRNVNTPADVEALERRLD